MSSKIDKYLSIAGKWREELTKLREIILDCQLTEQLKWGNPCYSLDDRNIVLIHSFKEYCAILFFKGALLKDTHNILVQQTENVQAARQMRFANLDEIIELEPVIKAYVLEASDVENAGLKVEFKETREFAVPEELQIRLDEIPRLRAAFESLTPGRQRGYLLYFAAAKQSKTRESRIEKYISKILEGKGLDD